jgi:hypothetical protein
MESLISVVMFVAVIGVLGFGVYTVFFNAPTNNTPSTGTGGGVDDGTTSDDETVQPPSVGPDFQ